MQTLNRQFKTVESHFNTVTPQAGPLRSDIVIAGMLCCFARWLLSALTILHSRRRLNHFSRAPTRQLPRPLPVLVAAFGLLAAQMSSAVSADEWTSKLESDFTVGLIAHVMSHPDLMAKTLYTVKPLGIASMRDDAPWAKVEADDGSLHVPPAWDEYVDLLRAQNIEPLLILDYGHPHYDGGGKPLSAAAVAGFARYAEFLVSHFKGRVHAYEVWNEWDATAGRTQAGSAEDYVRLLRAVYPVVKTADPSAQVFAGAMTPEGINGEGVRALMYAAGIGSSWLMRMVKAGGLDYCDRLSLHTYNYKLPADQRDPESWMEWIAGIATQLQAANRGRAVPLYITEMGWPSHMGKYGMSAQQSAAYLGRLLLLVHSEPRIRGLWWYELRDGGWTPGDKEQNFGLTRPDFTAKPALPVFAALADLLAKSKYSRRLDMHEVDTFVVQYEVPNRGNTWFAWQRRGTGKRLVLSTTKAGEQGKVLAGPVGQVPVTIPCTHEVAAESTCEHVLVLDTMPMAIQGNGLTAMRLEGVPESLNSTP